MADNLYNRAIYPFQEMFRVSANGATSVNVWDIPAGTIVTMVLAKIRTAASGTASNFILGDASDDNGFVIAFDSQSSADTVRGDMSEERGAYLTGTTAACCAPVWKVYTSAATLIMASSGACTGGVVDIFVFGYRYAED